MNYDFMEKVARRRRGPITQKRARDLRKMVAQNIAAENLKNLKGSHIPAMHHMSFSKLQAEAEKNELMRKAREVARPTTARPIITAEIPVAKKHNDIIPMQYFEAPHYPVRNNVSKRGIGGRALDAVKAHPYRTGAIAAGTALTAAGTAYGIHRHNKKKREEAEKAAAIADYEMEILASVY